MTDAMISYDHGGAELTCSVGVMRMVLMGSLKDADLWARSNASGELKAHWARRAGIIRDLLDQLPAPPNPRDPYEDLPDEPTPEEADRIWRERAAAEDLRAEAKRLAMKREPALEETPATPDLPGEIEETPLAHEAPTYDDDDLLA